MRTDAGPGHDALAGRFAATAFRYPVRHHQRRALGAVEAARAAGRRRAYLVLPPGAGKTVIGLEVARRLGRRTLVLGPNTAIQAQWLAQWARDFGPPEVPAGAGRDLAEPLTVLTYQALCTLDTPDDPLAGDPRVRREQAAERRRARALIARGGDRDQLLDLLHPNGRALVARLRQPARGSAGGDGGDPGGWTIVLDECHHLLELWGHLVKAVVDEVAEGHGPDGLFVLGLTATPPATMSAAQAALHVDLFGRPSGTADFEAPTPAVVKEGHLAPYQELVHLTTPLPREAAYVAGEAIRFDELVADLLDPELSATGFLPWVTARAVERRTAQGPPTSWRRFEAVQPALARAALRLHTAGLLDLPAGARLREEHRRPPAAEDWVALIEDYALGCLLPSGDARDAAAWEAIRRALPSIGYTLTRRGVRAGAAPVDRVLARSGAKAAATVGILADEAAALGDRVRALVLCDFENAGGELPARLRGVVDPQAGGARLLLELLARDGATAALDPVLLTGRTVACTRATATRLAAFLGRHAPELPAPDPLAGAGGWDEIVELAPAEGWVPRRYVPAVTAFFEAGESRCLVGTRALLGEGWDARSVNVLVDLTAATTAAAVHQMRGRTLRLDPAWPRKVAHNWGVVCVADGHPRGDADYDRFVRKHDHYFALTGTGAIESGVSHVDAALSPYEPPPVAAFAAVNRRMAARVGEREAAWERWAVGRPYRNVETRTVRIHAGRALGLTGAAVAGLAPVRAVPPGGARIPAGGLAGTWRAWLVGAGLGIGVVATAAPATVTAGTAAAAAAAFAAAAWRRAGTIMAGGGTAVACEDLAAAVADALHATGQARVGAGAVEVVAEPDGTVRCQLGGRATPSEAARFAVALDELLAPMDSPRWVIPRLVLARPAGRGAAFGLALRRALGVPVEAAVAYHAVPSCLATSKRRVAAFTAAWHRHVSPGEPLDARTPEGAAILDVARGDDPFEVTTQLRTLWR
jgi:superfamily II DNA or RNA helicase